MKKLIVFICLLIVSIGVSATTYYVSTTGSDSNPGTNISEWLTLNKATSTAVAGDIVIFKSGVYSYTYSGGTMADMVRSGTSDAYITYRSQTPHGAILDGGNSASFCMSVSGSYLNIEGFEIRWFAATAIATPYGSTNSYVNLRGLWIHDCGRVCIAEGSEGYQTGRGATYFHNLSHVIVERCTFNDIGRLSPAEGCSTATGMLAFDHALYLSGCSYFTIQNNVFYNINRGFALQLYGETFTDDHISFINNTCVDGNPQHPAGHVILWSNVSNILIADNIFKGHGYYAIQIFQDGYSSSNVIVRNNTTFGGNGILYFATTLTGVTISNNYTYTNPLFVGESVKNYALQSTSPCIGAGYNTGITTDFLNNPRIGAIDIGAYEYQNGVVTTYYNSSVSATATKNNCGSGYNGSIVTYTVPANTYSSTVSQLTADNLAIADVNSNKQAYANSVGSCTLIYSGGHGAIVNKNNVPLTRNNKAITR